MSTTVVRLFAYLSPYKKDDAKTSPSRRREKILMGSGRSVIYLPATRKEKDKTKEEEKKRASSAMSEKLNYAFESILLYTRGSHEK